MRWESLTQAMSALYGCRNRVLRAYIRKSAILYGNFWGMGRVERLCAEWEISCKRWCVIVDDDWHNVLWLYAVVCRHRFCCVKLYEGMMCVGVHHLSFDFVGRWAWFSSSNVGELLCTSICRVDKTAPKCLKISEKTLHIQIFFVYLPAFCAHCALTYVRSEWQFEVLRWSWVSLDGWSNDVTENVQCPEGKWFRMQ